MKSIGLDDIVDQNKQTLPGINKGPNEKLGFQEFLEFISTQLRKKNLNIETGNKALEIPTFEQEVFRYMNLVRTNPKFFVKELNKKQKNFKDKKYKGPGMTIAINTQEGVFAVNETISFLNRMKPVEAMTLSRGLCLGAKEYVTEFGPKASLVQKAGNLTGRIQKYGSFNGSCVDITSFGKRSAFELVMCLIIDDGLPSRPNRKFVCNASH